MHYGQLPAGGAGVRDILVDLDRARIRIEPRDRVAITVGIGEPEQVIGGSPRLIVDPALTETEPAPPEEIRYGIRIAVHERMIGWLELCGLWVERGALDEAADCEVR